MPIEIPTYIKSMTFYVLVSATSFQWNKDGSRNAIGVHAIAPFKDKNLSSFLSNISAETIVINTITAL